MSGSLTCPFCLWKIRADEEVGTCPDCAGRYHAECWIENQGCSTFGCPSWARREIYAGTSDAPPTVESGGTATAQTAPATRATVVVDSVQGRDGPTGPVTGAFCRGCGARLEADDRFCIECGTRVGD